MLTCGFLRHLWVYVSVCSSLLIDSPKLSLSHGCLLLFSEKEKPRRWSFVVPHQDLRVGTEVGMQKEARSSGAAPSFPAHFGLNRGKLGTLQVTLSKVRTRMREEQERPRNVVLHILGSHSLHSFLSWCSEPLCMCVCACVCVHVCVHVCVCTCVLPPVSLSPSFSFPSFPRLVSNTPTPTLDPSSQ